MQENKHEEVDLLYVIRSIKMGIQSLYNLIIWFIDFSFKKFWTLLLFVAAGGAIGGAYFLVKTPYYKSQMTISHSRLENDYCYEAIANLNSGIRESTANEELAHNLGVSYECAKKVKSISYRHLNTKIAEKYGDSVHVMLPFKVEAEVYDNSILDSLQLGILNYLESNPYATHRKNARRLNLDKTEERLDREILAVDSLKRIVDKSVVPQSSGTGIILGEPINPVLVYELALKLYRQKLDINERKAFNNSFDLVVGFPKNPVSGKGKIFFITLGGLIGYVVGLSYLVRRRLQEKKRGTPTNE